MGDFHPSEGEPDPDALADPVGEAGCAPLPFLLQKYPDRVLVLAAARCFFYCRFCFRRGEPPGSRGRPGPEEWARIFAWLAKRPEVEEVVLSGGDPLTLPDRKLAEIGRGLAAIPSIRRWRIHTRAPVVLPRRVTSRLAACLAAVPLPLTVVLHLDHPAELWEPLLAAVGCLRAAGIAVEAQSVLLAGVNDDPATLAALWEGLRAAGIRPRYLHHPDRAPGNRSFRVSMERGRGIVREAGRGAPPPYVVDLPSGRGKLPVEAVAQERGRARLDLPTAWRPDRGPEERPPDTA
ncbi:MAG: radical SAM protein [Thermodesulfobacteriota bacterium]